MGYQTLRALVRLEHNNITRIPGQTTGKNAQDFVCSDVQAAVLISLGAAASLGVAAEPVVSVPMHMLAGESSGVVVGVAGGAEDAVARAATSNAQNAVSPPSGAITLALGAAGLLNGNYTYNVIFVLDDGTKTDPWTGEPNSINAVNQSVILTAIPVSPSPRVVARELVRTNGSPVGTKAYQYLATINDNTTTTYVDNAADAALGVGVNWAGTQRGALTLGGSSILRANGQSLSIGTGATKLGYASISIGFGALGSVDKGLRNCAQGVYALTSLTDGCENTANGVHAGQNLTTGNGNVIDGYTAGWWINGDSNVIHGRAAMYGGSGARQSNSGCVILGNGAARDIAANVNAVIAIGNLAGRYANNSGQLFIDPLGDQRGSLSISQNSGLIYGQANANPQSQKLRFNASIRLGWGNPTVAQLPAANASTLGERCYVTDSNAAMSSAVYGQAVVGGGNKTVPVMCVSDDGGSTYRWAIG